MSDASYELIGAWTESGIRDQPGATRWDAFRAGWEAAHSSEVLSRSPSEASAGNPATDELLQSQARRVEELEGALRKMAAVRFGVSGKTGPEINEWFNDTARSALSEGSGSSRELAPPDESGDACGATERAEGDKA